MVSIDKNAFSDAEYKNLFIDFINVSKLLNKLKTTASAIIIIIKLVDKSYLLFPKNYR